MEPAAMGRRFLTSRLPQACFRARAQRAWELSCPKCSGSASLLSFSVLRKPARAVEVAADTERLRSSAVAGCRESNLFGGGRRSKRSRNLAFFCENPSSGTGVRAFDWRFGFCLIKRAESSFATRAAIIVLALLADIVIQGTAYGPGRFPQFLRDLRGSSFATHICRFSSALFTNNSLSWHLIWRHPFRSVAHNNGEIIRLSSNRRWLRAKAAANPFGRLTVGSCSPLSKRTSAYSASFDNGFELRLPRRLSSQEAILAMVPLLLFQKIPCFRGTCAVTFATALFRSNANPGIGPRLCFSSDGQFCRSEAGPQ